VSSRIETFSGLYIDPTDMKMGDIVLVDIAHALSNQCRFSGHTKYHYSVAEHSVIVCDQLKGEPPLTRLFALLHDASEAYLQDIPTPLKHSGAFEQYLKWEKILQNQVYTKYCGRLPSEYEEFCIKEKDVSVRKSEQRQLMKPHPEIDLGDTLHVSIWQGGSYASTPGSIITAQQRAKEQFIKRFSELV
jgi:5'-deoxynucleotidase YfbR-like HD superfamily hydrolase